MRHSEIYIMRNGMKVIVNERSNVENVKLFMKYLQKGVEQK